MSLFWRFYNWSKKRYIEARYKDKLPEITYDKSLHGYIHPYLCEEELDIELIAEELCNKCLCFEFKIGDGYSHHHEFHRVIEDAYNYGSQFSIPSECESDYSRQELDLLRKLALQGEMDRQKYRAEHDLPCVTMTTEDDFEEDEVDEATSSQN